MTRRKREIEVSTGRRSEMVDVTHLLRSVVEGGGPREGKLFVYIPHTTAAVTINEYADPAVRADILAHLEKMVPWEGNWRHGEGNSAAHIKASLMGSSCTIGISDGRLELGTWQGVFFCEFDGPRRRTMWVAVEPGG